MNCDICFVVPALQPKLKEESIGTLILAKKVIVEGFKAQIVRYWESQKYHLKMTIILSNTI